MPKPARFSDAHQRWVCDRASAGTLAALIAAREQQGLTRPELAEASSHRPDNALYRIETGRTSLSVDLLWDICRALGITPSALLAAAEIARRCSSDSPQRRGADRVTYIASRILRRDAHEHRHAPTAHGRRHVPAPGPGRHAHRLQMRAGHLCRRLGPVPTSHPPRGPARRQPGRGRDQAPLRGVEGSRSDCARLRGGPHLRDAAAERIQPREATRPRAALRQCLGLHRRCAEASTSSRTGRSRSTVPIFQRGALRLQRRCPAHRHDRPAGCPAVVHPL